MTSHFETYFDLGKINLFKQTNNFKIYITSFCEFYYLICDMKKKEWNLLFNKTFLLQNHQKQSLKK